MQMERPDKASLCFCDFVINRNAIASLKSNGAFHFASILEQQQNFSRRETLLKVIIMIENNNLLFLTTVSGSVSVSFNSAKVNIG